MDRSRVVPFVLMLLMCMACVMITEATPVDDSVIILLNKLRNRLCANVTCEGNRVCIPSGGRGVCVCSPGYGRANCDLLAPKCDTVTPVQCNDFAVQEAIYYSPVANVCQTVHMVVCVEKTFTTMAACVTACVK